MTTTATPKTFWGRPVAWRPGLRSLIVLVLAFGAVLGRIDHAARVQRQAVRAIVQAGGEARYDWQRVGSHSAKSQPWPGWIEQNLGMDYLHDVVEVDLSRSPKVTNEVLAQVGRLGRLEWLSLDASLADDAGLAHLEGLPNLAHLAIVRGRKITGVGLASIGKLTGLKALAIERAGWVDSDLAHLSALTDLLTLGLSFDESSRVGDAGIAHLAPLRQLQGLRFDGSRVSTRGLGSLREMTYLANLSLKKAGISDLEPLQGLAYLNSLDLSGNPVDDQGLAPLVGLPRFETLILKDDPALTEAGLGPLGRMPRLRRLDLRGTAAEASAARTLPGKITLIGP